MAEELKCTAKVKVADGWDNQGRRMSHQERCNKPAAEYEIGGLLGTAKAVLCVTHKIRADKEAFISKNGYPLGKIDENAENYKQDRLPGTGVKN